MSEKRWKAVERAIMSRLGGKRIPVTGRIRGEAADGEHDWLSPEIKHKNKLPDWLHDAMAQAVASQRNGQLPVVVLHQQGKRHADDYVIVRLGDWCDWFGTDEEAA